MNHLRLVHKVDPMQKAIETAQLVRDIIRRYNAASLRQRISGNCRYCEERLPGTDTLEIVSYNRQEKLHFCSQDCLNAACALEMVKFDCLNVNLDLIENSGVIDPRILVILYRRRLKSSVKRADTALGLLPFSKS